MHCFIVWIIHHKFIVILPAVNDVELKAMQRMWKCGWDGCLTVQVSCRITLKAGVLCSGGARQTPLVLVAYCIKGGMGRGTSQPACGKL